MGKKTFVLTAALLLLAARAHSMTTLKVPGDYDSIQDAVDAAVAGSVIRCRGTFREDVQITGKTGLTILGKCVIEGAGHCIRISDCRSVTLGKLVCSGASLEAILVSNSSDVTVSKCTVKAAGTDGIRVESSDRTRIEKCRIEDARRYGIYMTRGGGQRSAECRIEKNRIGGCGSDGIQCPGTDGLVVEKNRIQSCGEDGIAFRLEDGAVDALVVKNKLDDLGGTGIVAGGTGAYVLSNKVSRCLYAGIEVHGDGNVVERNKIKTVGDDGISFVEGPGRALRNRISDVGFFYPAGGFRTGDGIEFDTPGHTADGNTIKKCRSSGVHVWDVDGCTVTGNKVMRVGEDGFKVEGDGNALTRNKASKVGDDGFEVTGSGNTLRENTAKRSPDLDLEDHPVGGSNEYTDNRFRTTNL